MSAICVHFLLGNQNDSKSALRRESSRLRCARAQHGKSSVLAAEPSCSLSNLSGWTDHQCHSVTHSHPPLPTCLSHIVRASVAESASHCASRIATPDRFSSMSPPLTPLALVRRAMHHPRHGTTAGL